MSLIRTFSLMQPDVHQLELKSCWSLRKFDADLPPCWVGGHAASFWEYLRHVSQIMMCFASPLSAHVVPCNLRYFRFWQVAFLNEEKEEIFPSKIRVDNVLVLLVIITITVLAQGRSRSTWDLVLPTTVRGSSLLFPCSTIPFTLDELQATTIWTVDRLQVSKTTTRPPDYGLFVTTIARSGRVPDTARQWFALLTPSEGTQRRKSRWSESLFPSPRYGTIYIEVT